MLVDIKWNKSESLEMTKCAAGLHAVGQF